MTLHMARWSSPIRTHQKAISALEAILDDIAGSPGKDHPDLKYLSHLIPTPPDRKGKKDSLPEFKMEPVDEEAEA